MDAGSYQNETDRWQAVRDKNTEAGGRFVYAVATTGVFCRPGCASRTPRRENVTFFDKPDQALAAGYRACKRCRPLDDLAPGQGPDPRLVAACRAMEQAETMPGLEELAGAAGLSSHHFHRLFKAALGLTPKQYAQAVRLDRMARALDQGATVTEAVYAAGYGSPSRLYDAVGGNPGLSPGEMASGGRNRVIFHATGGCYLGLALVAATDKGICFIGLGKDPDKMKAKLVRRFPKAEIRPGDTAFCAWVEEVAAGLEVPEQAAALPLDIQGTAFQRRVWRALRRIPAGKTTTYSQLAAEIGKPGAARAVGRANATNPVAVAIPCHRVIRADGHLGGYEYGLEWKEAMLAAEAALSDKNGK